MFILLEINRERVTTHMEEEDHFTQTLLHCTHTLLHLIAGLLPLAAPPFLFSSRLSLSLCSQIMPLFIGINDKARGHQLWHKWWQHMGCTIFVNGWCNYHCSLLIMITLLFRVGCTRLLPINCNIPTINW